MNTYINLFETETAYESAKSSLDKPNVCFCEDTLATYYTLPIKPLEMVDLGLPSGKLWATCNVGATDPSENGLYFSWGNAEGHEYGSGYNFNGVTTLGSKDFYYTSPYFGTPGATIAGSLLTVPRVEECDVSLRYGSDFYIPTVADFLELYNNTTVSNVTIDGIYYKKFLNKNDSSKYILIKTSTGYYFGTTISGSSSPTTVYLGTAEAYLYGLYLQKILKSDSNTISDSSFTNIYKPYGIQLRLIKI